MSVLPCSECPREGSGDKAERCAPGLSAERDGAACVPNKEQRWDGEAVVPAAGDHVPLFLPLPGTPTEDTWPGITSNEEFRAYNFTQYRAQPLINHAPR